ncbi:head decoration protein [Schinkia azotoformans]|uniref:head decoration protein n=1 Tax=Schinkia azotoformans TaxID=1454 RepID=UPI002DB9F5E4|nr:head decoration protein [Schinkia azotoformans]MEC1744127.1 head decoration protein [Schinkia azotoformans]
METVGSFEYEHLIAGTFPVQTAIIKVASGQGILKRGSVLGKAADKSVILVGGATAATAQYIIADPVDTTETAGETIPAIVYVSGAFNRLALIIDGEGSIDDHEDSLKTFGIYLKAIQ